MPTPSWAACRTRWVPEPAGDGPDDRALVRHTLDRSPIADPSRRCAPLFCARVQYPEATRPAHVTGPAQPYPAGPCFPPPPAPLLLPPSSPPTHYSAPTQNAGFVKPGEGVAYAQEGHIGLHGRLPMATFGGLKARGHPVRERGRVREPRQASRGSGDEGGEPRKQGARSAATSKRASGGDGVRRGTLAWPLPVRRASLARPVQCPRCRPPFEGRAFASSSLQFSSHLVAASLHGRVTGRRKGGLPRTHAPLTLSVATLVRPSAGRRHGRVPGCRDGIAAARRGRREPGAARRGTLRVGGRAAGRRARANEARRWELWRCGCRLRLKKRSCWTDGAVTSARLL